MRLINYGSEISYSAPIFGAGADILRGALVVRGATPGTNNGELIAAPTGTNGAPDALGIMAELHDFSVSGDNLIAGTAFVRREVELLNPARVVRIMYDQSSVISATQAVTTTTLTLTSLEDNIDAAFLYVVSGTGLGQTNYAVASAAGACTLKAAFGTDLSTSSRIIKILPRFHQLAGLTANGNQLSSQAAAGGLTVIVLDSFIQRSGDGAALALDPTVHSNLTGLNNLASLRFWADVQIRNVIPYSID